MKVVKGVDEFPDAARNLDRRRMLRRAAMSVFSGDADCVAIERLGDVDRDKALSFRPRLSTGTELTDTSIRRDPFEIQIDEDEREVLLLSDGEATVADLAAIMASDFDLAEDPVERTIALLAVLGRYDMLATSSGSE